MSRTNNGFVGLGFFLFVFFSFFFKKECWDISIDPTSFILDTKK